MNESPRPEWIDRSITAALIHGWVEITITADMARELRRALARGAYHQWVRECLLCGEIHDVGQPCPNGASESSF